MVEFVNKILFIVFLFSVFILKVQAQDYVLNYEQLTTTTGLSNNFVNCVVEDSKGFMWFGTQDGLCRYDGNSYKTYKTNIEKKHILLSNNITSLLFKNDSVLYVGTNAGLHTFDFSQNTITPIKAFENQYIQQIFVDDQNTIWISTQTKKVFFKKAKQNNIENIDNVYPELKGIRWQSITQQKWNGKNQIFLISENLIKINKGGENHLYTLYGLENGKWKVLFSETNTYMDAIIDSKLLITKGSTFDVSDLNFRFKEKKDTKYRQKKINQEHRRIIDFSSKIHKNHLYIPLKTSILVIDLKIHQVINEIDFSKTSTTQNNVIKYIFIDKVGNLWAATSGEGILIFPTGTVKTIKGYRSISNDTSKGLSQSSTRAIYKDYETQKIWIGTYSDKKVIDIFSKEGKKEELFFNSYARAIKEDMQDATMIWAASYSGLIKIDKKTHKIAKEYFTHLSIQALQTNSDSTLLFADYENVYLFNTKKEIIQKKIAINKTCYIYQDKSKNIWLGTETDGFASWDLKTDKITYYNPEKNAVVKSFHVKCIYEDTKGKFWIATTNGLYNFDKLTQKARKFDTKNGLPNNTVYGILEDQNYNLWLSTNQGISKFDIENEIFENFDVNDGLQDNEYNTHSFFKSKDGELFFGGIKGVDAFFPNDLSKNKNKHIPKLFLTGFKRLGKEVEMDIPIENLTQLSLPIDSAQMLTFEFAALNFYQSQRNQYAYKIEELDTNWIQLGTKNELTLTGLAAGNYTLQIKGSNNQGVWNEKGIQIDIHIIPPFWKQNWFFITLLLLFLVGVYILYQVRIYQLQQREEKLELQIKDRTKELAAANRSKDQLFGIIAHDLRSPLTAFEDVSNQIEYFIRKNKLDRVIELGKHIDTSIQGLNILLNNLLGWSLVQQNHKIQINPQTMDLSEMVERILSIYKNVAQSNQINLKNYVKENTEIYVDIDSFQTILRNLISNALKYTPQNGTVIIQTIQENENVILTIQDTGLGMNEEQLKTIFEPNLIQSNRGIRGEKGTGLGLVLCQEFAILNNIKIEVESQPNEGTIFYLSIPTINTTV